MATTFFVTQSGSDRAIAADELAGIVARVAPEHPVQAFESLEFAVQDARVWAAQAPRRAVLVTGSITLIGDVMALATAEGWK
jgi:dihydrofolate synthase/folylpolyglutamate synthase